MSAPSQIISIAAPPPMVLGADGIPQPPTEIVQRLKQINPALGLKYAQQYGGGHHWAVTFQWPEFDTRRKYIQAGELPAEDDHDIMCWLPADCSVNDAYGYVVNSFRNGSTESARSLLDRVHEFNKNHKAALDAPLMDELREQAYGIVTKNEIKSAPTIQPRKRGKTARELKG